LLDCCDLMVHIRVRNIHHVNEQVCLGNLFQCCMEGGNQCCRQALYEAYRIGQVAPAVDASCSSSSNDSLISQLVSGVSMLTSSFFFASLV
jgi:hypothetical protein